MIPTTICVSLLPTALTISNPTPKNRPTAKFREELIFATNSTSFYVFIPVLMLICYICENALVMMTLIKIAFVVFIGFFIVALIVIFISAIILPFVFAINTSDSKIFKENDNSGKFD